MWKKIKENVDRWNMLSPGDCVITGVSGGADSVCLLFMLLELQKEIPFELVVVHVNHGLRAEDADADEAYVRSLCEQYGLPLRIYRENVELIAKNRKQSTEEAGREVRRAAFERTCEECGGTKIALAHHKNDNVETFFLNLTRGSGIKGLGGMLPKNERYIRPLLGVTREEIEAHLREHRIAYCEDATNQTDAYTRNRIRNQVIPYLEREVNAQSVAHIDEAMAQIREVWEYLEGQMSVFLEQCVSWQEDGARLCKEAYDKVPGAMQTLLLREMLAKVAGRSRDIEALHVRLLEELLEKQVGRKLDLPYGMVARRTYQGLELGSRNRECRVVLQEQVLEVVSDRMTQKRWGNYTIRCRVFEKIQEGPNEPQKNNTKWFDYGIMDTNYAISLRTRRPGDYLTIHPSGKTQKLKSYFINEKVPQEERDEVLIVAEGEHVLWAVGHRASCAYPVNQNTKYVLEIQVDEGETV